MTRFLRLSTLFAALVLAGVLQVMRPTLAFASFNCASSGDLNAAIAQAAPGSAIAISGTCAGTFTIDKSLTLEGDPTFGGTVSRLLVAPGSGSVTLRHLAISGGSGSTGANGLPIITQQDGGAGGYGGLDIENGTVNVNGVSITGNRGGDGGDGENVGIPKSKFTVGGNGGRGGVGGVLIDGGSVTFNGVTVSGNQAGNGGRGADGTASAGNGGNAGTAGVEVGGGTVTFEDSQIENNGSDQQNGGYGGNGPNAASAGYGGDGGTGGLYVRGGSVNLIASTVNGNIGSTGGVPGIGAFGGTPHQSGTGGMGGIFAVGGTVGLYNTTLVGNGGGGGGPAVDWTSPPGMAGNAGDGAARIVNGSTLTLVYSTVWGNDDASNLVPSGVFNGGGTITGAASIVQGCSGPFDDEGDNAMGDNSCVDPVNGPAVGTVVGGVSLRGLTNGYNSTPLLPENVGSSSIGNIAQARCDTGFPGPSGSGIPNPSGSGDLIFADQRGISRAHRNCDAGSFQTLATPTVDLLHDANDDTGISPTDDVTSNNRPTLKGQLVGGTGLTATVYDNGRSLGTAVIGGTLGNNNFFFLRPSSALADGVHSITASVQDPDSGQSVISAASKVTVETGAPNVFIVPRSQTFSSTGIYDPDAGGTTLTVTAGVSDPGGVTALSCTDGATNVASISNATASAQITHDVSLKSGSHAISCTGTGAAGNQGSLTQTFFVKKTSGIPVVGGTTDRHGVTTLTAGLSDDQGNGVNGKTMTFFVKDGSGNWVQVCGVPNQPVCPITQTINGGAGVAVLAGPALPGGYTANGSNMSYAGVVKASFAGDAQDSAASGTGNLLVEPPLGGIVFDCPTTETALQADITRAGEGGQLRLLCQHDTTIHFDTASGGLGTPISLYQVTISTFGSPARVILDGGGQTQLFHIADPASLPPGSLHASVEIDSVQLQNGHTDGGGGALAIDAGTTAVLNGDTFTGNTSGIAEGADSGAGGAISNAGTLALTDDTFAQNESLVAGGALANTGTATVKFSTFSTNGSLNPGGAISSVGGSITMGGDIVADTSEGTNPPCFIPGGTNDIGYNLEWNGTSSSTSTCGFSTSTGSPAGTDIVGTDPRLGPLQDNSGDTAPETVSLMPGIDGVPSSPAIDAIPVTSTLPLGNALCPVAAIQTVPLTDERNVARPNGSGCDIGSYEYIWGSAPALSDVIASETYSPTGPVPVSLTATLKDQNGQPLVGKTIVFSMPNDRGQLAPLCGGASQIACPSTGSDGVATLDGIDQPGPTLNAGSYPGGVVAQFTGDTTDNGAQIMGALDVARAQNVVSLSFDSPLAPLPPQSYGNPPFDLSNYSTFEGTGISFQSETTHVCTVNGNALTIVGAGVCTVQASAPADPTSNYSDAVPVEASFPISPATLQVFASGGTIIAGQSPPAITANLGGFFPGDTAATAVSGTPECSTTATASSPAGDYPTTCTPGTLGSANYTFQFIPGTLHLQRPTATIILDTSTLNPVYNGTPRSATATTNPAGLPYSVSYTDANGNPTGPPTAPGVYTVTAQITDPSQLALPVTGTLVLHKAVLEVTCDDQSITSGGSIPTLTYKIKGNFVGNDTSSVVSGTPTCSTPATSTSTPGTYPIIADVSGLTATNYTIIRGPDGTLTISQVAATITLDQPTLSPTYNGSPHAVTATTTPSGLSYAVTYTGTNGTIYGPSTTPPTGAGNYSVDASITDPNYSASDATGTEIIARQATSMSVVGGSGTYAGTATLVATLKDVSGAGLPGKTITFSVNGNNVCGGTSQPHCPTTADGRGGTVQGQASLSGVSLAGVNAGTDSGGVSASFSDDANYAGSGTTGDLNVARGSAQLSLSNLIQTYSGSPEGVTVTTSPSGLTGVSVTYTGTNGTSYPTSTNAPTNAGSYAVEAALSNGNLTASDATGTLTINKADQTINVGTTAPGSAAYGSQFTVAATAPGGVVTYGSSGVCSNNGATYTMTAGTGTCTVSFDQAGNGNDNPAKEVTETVTATKSQLSITTDNQTVQYSDHLPTLTVKYSGFASNDGPSSLSGSLSCSTAATVNSSGQVLSPAGNYAITCSGQSSVNYAITYAAGTLTVTLENTVVKPAANNPADLQVTKAGGYAPQFTLGATITEASDGSYGDITKASPITFLLTPIGGGAGSSCAVPSTSGSVTKVVAATASSPGSETVSCTFPVGKVGVNVYDVTVSVGGTYYTGSTDGVLTVFDMSQTGVQWGGGTVVNPVTGNTASVGFSASYNSSGGVVGKLIYVETDSKGSQTVLKGNNLATMAITKSSGSGYPETATITGKGVLNGVGNYGFVLTGVDAAGGTGVDADKFGLQVKDPTGAQVSALWYATAQLIASGNIFVK